MDGGLYPRSRQGCPCSGVWAGNWPGATFRYTEATALQIHKADEQGMDQPGAPAGGAGSGAASPSGSTTGRETAAAVGMTGELVTALVTVQDVDTKEQSDDRTLLTDVEPGDQIEITYTNALLVSVEK